MEEGVRDDFAGVHKAGPQVREALRSIAGPGDAYFAVVTERQHRSEVKIFVQV